MIFDLPVNSSEERKEYSNFRRFLINNGYLMLQFSVYSRYCHNFSDCEKHINRLKKNKPKNGDVRIIKLTENQFINMIILTGEKSEQEIISGGTDILVIE